METIYITLESQMSAANIALFMSDPEESAVAAPALLMSNADDFSLGFWQLEDRL